MLVKHSKDTYSFKLPDAISHAANGTESSKWKYSHVLSLEILPEVVGQTAVLQERPHAALASQESADTVGALVAQVDNGMKGGADSDIGGGLGDFAD